MIRAFGELAALYLLELLESARDRAARLWRRLRRQPEPEPPHLHPSVDELIVAALGMMTISLMLDPRYSPKITAQIRSASEAFRDVFRAATGEER